MVALAREGLIAAPVERDIEPGELAPMVEPGEIAGAGILQYSPGLRVLAQIDGEIETLPGEAVAQLEPIGLTVLQFAECRAGVEEIKFEDLVDGRLQRPHRA